MKTVTVLVKFDFQDKNTKKIYIAGNSVEYSEELANELAVLGFVENKK